MTNKKVIPLRPREQAAAELIAQQLGPNLLTTQDIPWIIRLVERKLKHAEAERIDRQFATAETTYRSVCRA
ncbi:MAG TPA: hypothetical protein VHJ19_02170 [Gammaproteobacteria bacterium]|nr:hypothetical protein [Gammaproteobacteria bacterium]